MAEVEASGADNGVGPRRSFAAFAELERANQFQARRHRLAEPETPPSSRPPARLAGGSAIR